jgi:hypothetical protein
MGQFMSWTLAKSAQTNKLLQRIENGDTKQLVKLLAGLPVYGGIQALREIAKYGEVQTDLETQTDKWYSEAVRLSGVSGTATELVLGRLTGPGSREPWYLFAPVFSILKDVGNIPKEVYKGNNDKALQIFSERIAPLPTWRKWIMKLFPDSEIITPVKQKDFKNRLQFNKGDIVDENNTDAVVVDQPFLEEAEAVASKKLILPVKKPSVEKQVQLLKEEKPLVLSDNQKNKGKEIYNIIKTKLSDKGIENPDNAAAAMTGNIFGENDTFIFDRQEEGDAEFKGHGLFQFTDAAENKGHRTEYFKYINNNDKEDNIDSQIDYVLNGIFSKEKSGYDIGYGNKKKLIKSFNSDDVKTITQLFMEKYENPKNDKSLNKRIQFAKSLFNNKEK